MANTAKIRPFEEYIEAEPGFSAVVISGGIAEGAYVVKAIGAQHALETVEVGEDQRGPFAVVKECDVPFSREFRLRLEADQDETSLDVFIPADGDVGTSRRAKRAFTVWFNSIGCKDGKSACIGGVENSKPVPVN